MRLVLGFRKPRQPILGTVFSGTVAALGSGVTSKVGDAVFGSSPGMRYGCHAEYVTIPASGPVALMPKSMGFDEAAALPFGGNTAYIFRETWSKSRESILINARCEAVGTMAVQIAKRAWGDRSSQRKNRALVCTLGANCFIDYTRDNVFAPAFDTT